MHIPEELTKCAPCAKGGMTRLAVNTIDDTPMCGPCGYEARQHKVLARLEADEAAKVRRPGIPVPAMTRGLIPEAVER